MNIPDWYLFLNYKLIDTSSDVMSGYNWIYIPFNAAESFIWMVCAAFVFKKHKENRNKLIKLVYSLAFILFSISDLFELSATTPLLLLYKLAVILILLVCRKFLKLTTPHNESLHRTEN